MSDKQMPERHVAGHGYAAGCECDLEGGDAKCTTQPPYETVPAYIDRLKAKIAEQAATIAARERMLDKLDHACSKQAATIERLTEENNELLEEVEAYRQAGIDEIEEALNLQEPAK